MPLQDYGLPLYAAVPPEGYGDGLLRPRQQIALALEDKKIPHNSDTSPWVTVSVGGVTVRPRYGDSYDTYLKIADTMLYDAKRSRLTDWATSASTLSPAGWPKVSL